MIGAINKILKKFVGDKSSQDLRTVTPVVEKINQLGQSLTSVSHDELRNRTAALKAKIKAQIQKQEEEIANLKIQAEALPGTELEQKESIFNQVDKLEKEIDQEIEKVLEEILPEAFAIVKETASRLKQNPEIKVKATEVDRMLATVGTKDYVTVEGDTATWKNNWVAAGNRITWDMVHYDVQLIGGIALHRGKVAEMATGEGKTLVATLPVFLNALAGRGVHVVTVNDYLARRDSEWMGPLYEFHGLTVDCIDRHQPNGTARRNAYRADITFGTNNEFGFDYLRDNMKPSLDIYVQRDPFFAIVDEVDSILIDEARTPLIISGPTEDRSEFYKSIDTIIPLLRPEHYEHDEKQRSVVFTEEGSERIEEMLVERGLLQGSLYEPSNVTIVHHANQALRAHKLFQKDKDYIVRNDEIVITFS